MEEKERELAYEYQLLQAQAGILSRNLELLSLAKAEMELVKETLDKLEGKAEVLIPIGASSYLKGVVTEPDKVILGVGSGYLVEKNIPDAIEFIEKKMKEYEELIEKTTEALKIIEKRLAEIATKVEEIHKISNRNSGL